MLTDEDIKLSLECAFEPFRCFVQLRPEDIVRFKVIKGGTRPLYLEPGIDLSQLREKSRLTALIIRVRMELRAKGYGFYASGALESLTKLSYEEIVEQEIGFIGTPDQVVRQVRELQAKGGIGELAIVANFGGLEHWKSIKTQDLFAKHVMPAFRQHTTQAAAD